MNLYEEMKKLPSEIAAIAVEFNGVVRGFYGSGDIGFDALAKCDSAVLEIEDAMEGVLLNVEPPFILSTNPLKTFSEALIWMKLGYRVRRTGWNAGGQFAFMQKGYPDGIGINKNTAEATGIPEGTICKFRPYFMLYTAQGDFAHWVPSGSDVLASDWEVVE